MRTLLQLVSLFLACTITFIVPGLRTFAADENAAGNQWPAEVKPKQTNPAYGDPLQGPKPVWPPKGTPQKIEITADDWLSGGGKSASKENTTNNGKAFKMKLKGHLEHSIFDIDAATLKGKIVTGALLHLRNASPDAPFWRVGVSSIASPWKEGSGKSYNEAEGEVCFAQAEFKKRDWSFTGSNFMDVSFGRGNTTWKFADCTPPDAGGWQTLAVDPQVVATRISGIGYGFAMCDEVGSEWQDKDNQFKFIQYPNRFCYSHEEQKFAPWLEVWTDGTDNQPPEAVQYSSISTDGLPAGEALVKFIVPEDKGGAGTLGFFVTYARNGETKDLPRYLIPMAQGAGSECVQHIHDLNLNAGEKISLAIKPVDAAGNVGAEFKRDVVVSSTPAVLEFGANPLQPFPPSVELPSAGDVKVAIIDTLDKADPVSGALIPESEPGYKGGNHIFNAPQKLVRLQSGRNEFVSFQVLLEGKSDVIGLKCEFPDAPGLQVSLHEFGYTNAGPRPLPDPLLPCAGTVSIPSKAGKVSIENQRFHGVICEIYVPHEEAEGTKQGKLKVTSGGNTLELNVSLTVWPFTLPNKLSFIPEMNSYRTEFSDPRWYKLAHRHRVCINQLPYVWSGLNPWKIAWNGSDFDFQWFDQQAGPLLDGSLFADMPRKGEPVDLFFLPFNENWPAPLLPHFKKQYWADQAFDSAYVQELQKALAAFARHIEQKKWNDTLLEVFLNAKIFFRAKSTRVVAPWTFDEPANTQDFWALRWYGQLFHQAVDDVRGSAKMIIKADVSRSEHEHEMLTGIFDLECLAGLHALDFRRKNDQALQTGSAQLVTTYGDTNPIDSSNAQTAAWAIGAWAEGARGIVPWDTFGKKDAWTKADQNAVFYALDGGDVAGSVRLNAYTTGQQLVEYLTMLQDVSAVPRFAVAGGVKKVVDLTSKHLKSSEMDAGQMEFTHVTSANLWNLKMRIGTMLAAKRPPYKRSLVDCPIPKTDLKQLPNIGYVPIAPEVKPQGPDASSFHVR